jgi:uncharacterized protein (DUF433 family)
MQRTFLQVDPQREGEAVLGEILSGLRGIDTDDETAPTAEELQRIRSDALRTGSPCFWRRSRSRFSYTGYSGRREARTMPALDWSQCPAVESIPGKVSGAWVLRGTRTPVKVLFENLEAGMSIEEVIEQFPVTREQLDSLMAFVARSLEKAPSYG